ncbi:MAG TPA: hypothetical protein VN645_10885 [Steroidobacteraceae bacterium]|nr:hypothetical protein [Steroidobacteraceae bacterium]
MSTAAKVGFWSSLAAFAMAAGYSIVQILQMLGVLTFPWDEILIFGFSIGIPVPFVLAMVALHHSVLAERRIWTHCAIVLATMYAVLVTIVYATQLAVVVPLKLAGAADMVRGLTVSSGTFMWVIDGAGYVLMGLATLFAAGTFAGNHSQRWLRRFLIANGLIDPIIIAVYVWPWLLPAGGLWIITAPGSLWLLARYFRQSVRMDAPGTAANVAGLPTATRTRRHGE